MAAVGFDEQFEEIARDLTGIGDAAVAEATRFRVAHGLVEDAMHLIRNTAPDGLESHHAWLGAVQIVNQFAHEVAHDAMEAEGQ